MIVPNAENAFLDIRKLTDYCLNPHHEIGKYKARVFASALDLTLNDAAELVEILLVTIKSKDAKIGKVDKYGGDLPLTLNGNAGKKEQLSEVVG